MTYKGYTLDRFQREAIEGLQAGRSVVVAAPTGCGKTLIAEYAIDQAIAQGRRAVYTSPIKALSNQKFRDFGAVYGDKIGIMTGDVTINPDAPILIMTTEIFRNTIFDDPKRLADVDYCIFDEIHYLDDPERGTVWEESIIFAPEGIRFLCLSATISNLDEFADWIRWVRGQELVVIREEHRPVPLDHRFYLPDRGAVDLAGLGKSLENLRKRRGFGEDRGPRHWGRGRGRRHQGQGPNRRGGRKVSGIEVLDHALDHDLLPAIYFVFNRADTESLARSFANRDLLNREEHLRLARYLDMLSEAFESEEALESTGLGALLLRGVAYHHAGLMPVLKEVVERLFTTGLIKVLFATETFALGVNMPARAVVFDSVTKFNGVSRVPLMVREYQQMAGRAGRRGIDEQGYVFSRLEETVDEYETARRLATGTVEEVHSQFGLSYSSLLSLYEHLGERVVDACARSFGGFQSRRRGSAGKGHGQANADRSYNDMVNQLRMRLRFLKDNGFIEEGGLTPKGRFASKIYGHEVALTELYFRGDLEDLNPMQLGVLFAAMVFEPRKDQNFRKSGREELGFSRKHFAKRILKLRMQELKLGIQTIIKAPDFRVAPLILSWGQGCRWEQLDDDVQMSDGDRVRVLRQTIQLLRQFAEVIKGEGRVEPRVKEAMRRLDRDEVDAEAQLRRGEELDKREDAPGR